MHVYVYIYIHTYIHTHTHTHTHTRRVIQIIRRVPRQALERVGRAKTKTKALSQHDCTRLTHTPAGSRAHPPLTPAACARARSRNNENFAKLTHMTSPPDARSTNTHDIAARRALERVDMQGMHPCTDPNFAQKQKDRVGCLGGGRGESLLPTP